jgi:hypothetical protein
MKLGACHVETPFIELGQLSTALYFGYFILIVPSISLIENTLIDLSLVDFKKSGLTNVASKGVTNLTFKRGFSTTTSIRGGGKQFSFGYCSCN